MPRQSRSVFRLLVLVAFSLFPACSPAQSQQRAEWLGSARWGVMTHYLADWRARVDRTPMSSEMWNEMIDQFDVEGLAKQVSSVGAGYYILTVGQNSGYYLSPNATYDRLVGNRPGRCSKRDLILDLARALAEYNIRLIAYLPSGAPAGDSLARVALGWRNGAYRNREFQLKWEEVIREWSLRWGKEVAGWWFDGCYWPNAMYRTPEPPNFESFAAAARAGNSESIVTFNPGVVPRLISVSPYEDYTAGEIDQPERMSIRRAYGGLIDGAQLHVLSYLGERWGMGAPRFTIEQIIGWSTTVAKEGGVITWDVPIQRNGLIAQSFLDQLAAVGKALNAQ